MRETNVEGLRLLLVEDEYLLALYMTEMLEDLGARVVGPVGSVDEALGLLAQAPALDAAILDVNLGGEAVFPVADALVARRVPFVFASGYDASTMPERFRDTRVCQKPVDAREFTSALSALR